MQSITPPTTVQLLAPDQLPLMKFELFFPDNHLGTMTFDSGSVEPQVNEILTGATSAATAKVFSVDRTGGTWGGTNANGTIELRDCSGCFNDNEDINGSVGGANMLTVDHAVGVVGVDKFVKNGAFVPIADDPPTSWIASANVTLTTEAGGQIGNCMRVLNNGAPNRWAVQYMTVVIGKIYKVSVYAKASTADAKVFVGSSGADPTNSDYMDETQGVGAWTEFTTTFTATTTSVNITCYSIAADVKHAYFDEVTLYELDEWINLCDLDSKNYVENWSISLGGASMTPNPVGGKWSATLFNEDGIFHPDHGGPYTGYCVTGRKVRISIGGTYGGTDYYWQRLIGWMNVPRFSLPDYRVQISGGDYMKLLEDAQFQELDNYWGTSLTFDSWLSTGLLGDEMYTHQDAMNIENEIHDVPDWVDVGCDFSSLINATGGSLRVGRMINADAGPPSRLLLADVGTDAEAGHTYRVRFKHKINGGDGSKSIRIQIWQTALIKEVLYFPTDEWKEETLYFVATDDDPIEWRFRLSSTAYELWLDQFSVWEYKPYEERFHQLPGESNGAYHVTYNDNGNVVPVQQGEEDEGWYHEESTKRVFFDLNKVVIDGDGLNNVEIFYFTGTVPEDAVARILYFAKVPDPATGVPYVNEAAAKTAMDFDATGITVDRIWFKAGSTFLDAIRMLCELTNHRFHFAYDGQPIFKDRPTVAGAVDFDFTSTAHIASSVMYQSWNEIKNRIVIKGNKQAEPVNRDETTPSELKGEEHNDASITSYGERTMTITNHLFQDQTELNQMCVDILAERKDPKWYSDLEIPFNPVPLELGDTMEWEERINHTTNVTKKGVIRDIKITKFNTTYKCEL